MTLIEDLLGLQVPSSVKISPDSQSIVYATSLNWGSKTGEHDVSTIWLANTGKPKSARQITSGQYNDHAPKWSPSGDSIAFLSDRGKQGESSAIYILPLSGGEAHPVTPAENERSIDKFEFSPDGKTVAFLSADEKSEEKKAREKAKNDAQVWGEDWAFNRLRVVHIGTKTVTVIVSKDAHIVDFAWNDAGTQLGFTEVRTPNIESPDLYGTTISTVDIESKEVRKVTHFPGTIRNLTRVGAHLYFTGSITEMELNSSQCVYHIDLSNQPAAYAHHAHGTEDCAMGLVKAGGDVTVMVQHGMEDQIRILGGHMLFSKKRKLLAWDAAFTHDSDEIVLAVVQGDTNHPIEVYSTTASGGAMVPLSNHGHLFAEKQFGTCTFVSCPSSDGKVQLECPWLTPSTVPTNPDGTPTHPLPTVVLVHGGPYYRHTESFDSLYFLWSPLLLSAGYGVLIADYRGSSGRGEDWAAYARQVGTSDYEDVIAQTQHIVEKGYADKDRLMVGGWSSGGFLTYLCTVRNGTHGHGWHFKAAIPGAGITDCDTMIFTSDIGSWQASITAGGKPWQAERKDDTRNRSGSAIWEFGDAMKNKVPIPTMLILHGEKDERVPLEQSVATRRALVDAGLPFEYVVYPREGHIIQEMKHLVDMDERVLRFVDKHIGGK